MHMQATGILVQLALRFNKPYAVIPCCVFGDLFPDRRLSVRSQPLSDDSQPSDERECTRQVLSYDDLVEWLVQLDDKVNKFTLIVNVIVLRMFECSYIPLQGKTQRTFLKLLGKNQVVFRPRICADSSINNDDSGRSVNAA